MKPEYSLYCSIAAVFGFIGLTMLALAGSEPVVVWFLASVPMWWSLMIYMVSLWWERREREWKDREREWEARAIRAEGAASLWKAMAGLSRGSGRGSTDSLSALAKACGSRQALISLLHPDRHRNSRASNNATAYVMKHLPK